MANRPNLDEWRKNGALMDVVNADGVTLSDYWTRIAYARVYALIQEHAMTMRSVSGFLGVCSCGEAIDSYQGHLLELIDGELEK